VKSTRIRDYNAVRFCVKANEANECSVRNQRRARGKAEETPTPVGGGELELIECTIETCLFVEIKCVHYIANTRTHVHVHVYIINIYIREPQTHTRTHIWGKNCCREEETIILVFLFLFFFSSAKQVDNLTPGRVLHRELL